MVVILSSYSARSIVYASYQLNKSYITEVYCVNKNKPWMHCNGHCFLMKKLRQAEEKEKQQRTGQQEKFQEAIFPIHQSIPFFNTLSLIEFPRSWSGSPVNIPLLIFHPPPPVLGA
jgi:hypothetical protein